MPDNNKRRALDDLFDWRCCVGFAVDVLGGTRLWPIHDLAPRVCGLDLRESFLLPRSALVVELDATLPAEADEHDVAVRIEVVAQCDMRARPPIRARPLHHGLRVRGVDCKPHRIRTASVAPVITQVPANRISARGNMCAEIVPHDRMAYPVNHQQFAIPDVLIAPTLNSRNPEVTRRVHHGPHHAEALDVHVIVVKELTPH